MRHAKALIFATAHSDTLGTLVFGFRNLPPSLGVGYVRPLDCSKNRWWVSLSKQPPPPWLSTSLPGVQVVKWFLFDAFQC